MKCGITLRQVKNSNLPVTRDVMSLAPRRHEY